MQTSSRPPPASDLFAPLYCQVVYTLTSLLPPPLDNTPDALHDRNHAAIAKVAALLPVNANEADLAAQCIAARAQAEDVLRLLRRHANDIGVVLRLNAQYASMLRTSLSVHGRLMRVQALRHKRDAIEAFAKEDARALRVAERCMLAVFDPEAGPQQPASPKAAPVATPVEAASLKEAPAATSVDTPAADIDQWIEQYVSGTGTASQDAALETWLSAQLCNRGSKGSEAPVESPGARVDERAADAVSETGTESPDAALETWLSEQPLVRRSEASTKTGLREATANLRLDARELPANGREIPGRADHGCHIDKEIASI